MTFGFLIIMLLSSYVPESALPVNMDMIILQTINKNINWELLDDFDTNPGKPEDKWIGMDKFWHWAMAFALTGSSYHFIRNRIDTPDPDAFILSVSGTLLFSVAKEFYDLARYNLFSYKDLCYDILGIATGYFVFIRDWGN